MTVKKSASKALMYPWFLECCNYAKKDSYWENIFENLARGTPPFGTYISKGSLCCGYKKKEFSYTIERKNAKIVYNEVYDLLHSKLGLMSQKERALKRVEFDNNTCLENLTWAKIRKKTLKKLLIEQYVVSMKNKHHLSTEVAKTLLGTITMYISFKVIGNKDIDYKNGKINNIKGIEFKTGTETLLDGEVIPLRALHITSTKTMTDNPTQTYMSDLWKKHIKNMKIVER